MLKKIHAKQFPTLQYKDIGSGEVIVLLHGFPLDSSIWREVAETLAGHYRVLMPDIPGSGGSTFAGEAITVEDMAKSVKHILDEEGISNAIIAGHSMGGYAALAFADLYPDATGGLAMIHSTPLADTEEKKEQRRKTIDLINKGGKTQFIKQMIPALFAEGNKEQFKAQIEALTVLALLTDNKSLVAFYNAMINRPDRSDVLKDSKIAVLWCLGAQDGIIPLKNLMQQTSLASVNFVNTYEGCGHMGMIEVPVEMAGNIKEFADYCYRSGKNENAQ